MLLQIYSGAIVQNSHTPNSTMAKIKELSKDTRN